MKVRSLIVRNGNERTSSFTQFRTRNTRPSAMWTEQHTSVQLEEGGVTFKQNVSFIHSFSLYEGRLCWFRFWLKNKVWAKTLTSFSLYWDPNGDCVVVDLPCSSCDMNMLYYRKNWIPLMQITHLEIRNCERRQVGRW